VGKKKTHRFSDAPPPVSWDRKEKKNHGGSQKGERLEYGEKGDIVAGVP